ncbi:efflux RND transporter permease subunit [Sphingomonas sp. LHG3406-1]|uniref:efflux RND transporter permease subunit n=1 Tax=Sphingomonas sp. LHG3406-1 TaxID=2804617 RepID=UPI0026341F09|nr:efflux RND transporter permease subunit [Sphingomonas sp. LHG3406-1]
MFARIVTFSLRNRVFVIALSALLMAYGALVLTRLPVDVFPDLDKSVVTVMTESEGLGTEETEQLVTVPLENVLNGTPGVSRVRSTSAAGLSIVYVEFGWGEDVLVNRQQVAERLQTVRTQLPPGVQPQMAPISSIMGEIMLIAITSDRASPMELRELGEFVVRPKLLAIPGIANAIPLGGELRQYLVAPRAGDMARLGVDLEAIERAAQDFARNSGGGFVERGGRELSVRNVGRSIAIDDLAALPVATATQSTIRLDQVADVRFAAAPRRGDGGSMGKSAVIVSVSKQPGVDTVELTRAIERSLAELDRTLPRDITADRVQFRQADFIEASVSNVERVLIEALIVVAVVLYVFLRNWRTTAISLLAIPFSVLVTAIVLSLFGLSLNTMTLGGIAIAVGELVDDAVVDVENIFRRLRENRAAGDPLPVMQVIASASQEVRSGIIYATGIIVLAFVPLFALGGLEGQLFRPLGIAYICAILASLLVSITLTPALASYLLPRMKSLDEKESGFVRWLKQGYQRILRWAMPRERLLYAFAAAAILVAAVGATLLPRAFLPDFNEGTLTVNITFQPGTSLSESARIGSTAERLLLTIPEVRSVGRRTGRAEMDEHAEGVHYNELDVDLRPGERSREEIFAAVRDRLAAIPASVSVGQPISHRLDHLQSGVRAQVVVKVFGEDIDTLRSVAGGIETGMRDYAGFTDVSIERIVRTPQLDIVVNPSAAAFYGITPAQVTEQLEVLTSGRRVAEVIDGQRRFDVVVRLPEADRDPASLAAVLIATPGGQVPLGALAEVREVDAPNQVSRENGRRRLAVLANLSGETSSQAALEELERILETQRLPAGYSTSVEGTFTAQQDATRTIGLLSLLSLGLIFAVLYARYRSAALALIIIGSVPMALVGSVLALAIAGQTLSVASMVGFITLAGIAARNGILKVSHYLNLVLHEGERFDDAMIMRGSLERLVPVMMTALAAAFALLPLMIDADSAGKEILHPVAITIFGGLITSTLLDSLLTPLLFRRFGNAAVARLAEVRDVSGGRPAEVY